MWSIFVWSSTFFVQFFCGVRNDDTLYRTSETYGLRNPLYLLNVQSLSYSRDMKHVRRRECGVTHDNRHTMIVEMPSRLYNYGYRDHRRSCWALLVNTIIFVDLWRGGTTTTLAPLSKLLILCESITVKHQKITSRAEISRQPGL